MNIFIFILSTLNLIGTHLIAVPNPKNERKKNVASDTEYHLSHTFRFHVHIILDLGNYNYIILSFMDGSNVAYIQRIMLRNYVYFRFLTIRWCTPLECYSRSTSLMRGFACCLFMVWGEFEQSTEAHGYGSIVRNSNRTCVYRSLIIRISCISSCIPHRLIHWSGSQALFIWSDSNAETLW